MTSMHQLRKVRSRQCRWSAALFVLLFVVGWSTARLEAARPNILFCLADDWSYGHASIAGCPWINTPGFDQVARAGLRFTRAYTPNAKCAPSRSTLLTGRYSWQLKAAANHGCYFPPEFKVYPEVLREAGYFVGYTGKGWGPGLAVDATGKRRSMTGIPFQKRKHRVGVKGINPNDYAANFADFLAAAPADQPWCFWFGATEPHRAYEYGVGARKAGKTIASIRHVPAFWPDNEVVRHDMLDYAFEVEHFDRHVGRMLSELKSRDLLDNTIVIVTSDHGMPFPRCKGQACDHSNHVPLAIMWPKGIHAAGRTIDDYVSFADIAPTVIQAAGLKWNSTGMAPMSGRSLFDIFRSEQSGRTNPARDHVLIGKERHDVGRPHDGGYPIRGIVKHDWLYLHNYETDRWPAGNPETGYLNCDGGPTKTEILEAHRKSAGDRHWKLCFGKRPPEELYHLTDDPDCVHNLIADPRYASLRDELKRQMERELEAQHDPRMAGHGEVFDHYPYADPRTRHFYERFMRGEKLKAGWVHRSDFEPRSPGKQP